MARKLISLSFKPSTELPELDELKAFLATDFGRQIPGFTVLDSDVKWGDLTLDVVGADADGALIAVFPAVSRQERDFHEVISQALVASTWLEENKDEVKRRYGDHGVNPDAPLRMVLVAPALANQSRALQRALDRAGVEVRSYSIYEIETSEGPLLAVSFDTKGAPTMPSTAPSRPAAPPREVEKPREAVEAPKGEPVRISSPKPEPVAAEPAKVELPKVEPPRPEPPRVEQKPEPKPPSVVEVFISSLPDPNVKAMSEQILTFLVSRFPMAVGVVSPQDRGFTLVVGTEHLATIRLDKSSLWLEVGPERIPTNKIKDPATLERAMNLPSVLEALASVHDR